MESNSSFVDKLSMLIIALGIAIFFYKIYFKTIFFKSANFNDTVLFFLNYLMNANFIQFIKN